MTSELPSTVSDDERLSRAILTRHHVHRVILDDGSTGLEVMRGFFFPFDQNDRGLSAFRRMAGMKVIKEHANGMFSYCGFGHALSGNLRDMNATVDAAPIPRAPEHANIGLADLISPDDVNGFTDAQKGEPIDPSCRRRIDKVIDRLTRCFTITFDEDSKGYRKAMRYSC